jgi:IS30 family transposase
MAQGKQTIWTKDLDDALRAMLTAGMTTRAIGEALGMTQSTVTRRINATRMRANTGQVVAAPIGSHLTRYKEARRGFSVPKHLELDYYELLKTGLPIVEARRRLGIEA